MRICGIGLTCALKIVEIRTHLEYRLGDQNFSSESRRIKDKHWMLVNRLSVRCTSIIRDIEKTMFPEEIHLQVVCSRRPRSYNIFS